MRIELAQDWAPGLNETPIPEGTVVAEIKVLQPGVHPRQIVDGFHVGIMRQAEEQDATPPERAKPKGKAVTRKAAVQDE